MSERPTTIDEYLTPLSPEKRAALETIRAIVHSEAPEAVECIAWSLPSFRLGKLILCFGAAARHCAIYPMSMAAIEAHSEELAGFDYGKGTIRFQPANPLPEATVRSLVRYRLAENARPKP